MNADDFTFKGSIISGTHRPEDLIPKFLETLDQVREEWTMSNEVIHDPEMTRWMVRFNSDADDAQGDIEAAMKTDGYFDSDAATEDLEWLTNALDELAPDGYYFGAHEGDGADFGYWVGDDVEDEDEDEDDDGDELVDA